MADDTNPFGYPSEPVVPPASIPSPSPTPATPEPTRTKVELTLGAVRTVVIPVLGVILILWSLFKNQPGLLVIGAGLLGLPGMTGITSSMGNTLTKEAVNGKV